MKQSFARRAGVSGLVVLAAATTLSVLGSVPAQASDNGLSLTPAMGWSSWSFVRRNPTEAGIVAQADALKKSGLTRAGYKYVNVDDFYQKCDANGFQVDEYGRWATDPAKFPDGIKAVADHVHANGQKFGLYVTPGIPKNAVLANTPIEGTPYHAQDIADTTRTEKNYNCKNMYFIDYTKPGAQEYVNSWARQFAAEGVDYLKIDGVTADTSDDIKAWASALKASGRPINYALSNNLNISGATLYQQYANSWRTQGDIECYCPPGGGGSAGPSYPLTSWAKMKTRFASTNQWQPYARPGAWPDYDSIEIGNGDNDGVTPDQRRTQYTLWSMASAPLILGTDLTNLDPADVAILRNRNVIGVDQDGVAAKRVDTNTDAARQVFAKKERDGAYVVALFNTGDTGDQTVSIDWSTLGVTNARLAIVHDLWSDRIDVNFSGTYSATLHPGESRLIRVYPISLGHKASTPQ